MSWPLDDSAKYSFERMNILFFQVGSDPHTSGRSCKDRHRMLDIICIQIRHFWFSKSLELWECKMTDFCFVWFFRSRVELQRILDKPCCRRLFRIEIKCTIFVNIYNYRKCLSDLIFCLIIKLLAEFCDLNPSRTQSGTDWRSRIRLSCFELEFYDTSRFLCHKRYNGKRGVL